MREIGYYAIEVSGAWRDILLAFLSESGFEHFQETDAGLDAFPAAGQAPEDLERRLRHLQRDYPFTFVRKTVPAENWNAAWESRFHPIRVGHFCGVRADFHYPFLDVQHELVITPSMTFGTGHHDTTYMMLEEMEHLDFRGAKVLDLGCGTGILAILAARMGATMVDAVDIDPEAYRNTLHNLQVNDVDSVQVIHGTLDAVIDSGYRVILANINRNVLLASLPALHEKLEPTGTLLLSGILRSDKAELARAARRLGLRTVSARERGEWACLGLRFSG